MQALVRSCSGLELRSVPDPSRDASDSVLIEVMLVSLNRGETSLPWRTGQVVGWDAYGTVLESSADGQGPSAGALVTTWGYSGAWAERRVVSRHNVATVPDDIDPFIAAALPAAGVSALHAVKIARISQGTRCAIVGGTGGVGHLAAQIASSHGAVVTAITRDPVRATEAHRHLGDSTIAFASLEGIDDSAEFDVVIDTVGGAVLARLTKHLARRGRVVLVGSAGGEHASLDTAHLISRKASLVTLDIPTPLGNDIADLLDLVSTQQLRMSASDGGSWTRLVLEPASQLMGMGKSVFRVE